MKCENKCDNEGICTHYLSINDGLSLRCSGEWAKRKVEHFKYYTEMFATGMKYKWSNRYYIDLFSGPGKCIVRETLEEFDGSPLNAININDKFTHYYFADFNSMCIEDLKKRTTKFSSIISYYNEDCNNIIKEIIKDIPVNSLSLAIIDPSSLQFNFPSYEILSQRKIDLIINYPIASLERAIASGIKTDFNTNALNKFHPGWDKFFKSNLWGDSKKMNFFKLKNDYINKIKKLGYYSSELSDSVAFKNVKNTTLYYLIAFSKDKKGIEFWEKAKKSIKKKSPQQSLL